VRRFLSTFTVAVAVVLLACSTDSGGDADAGSSPTCDDNNGPCAPQCIPYALCTSEGSTCVIGGAACGHYWICHDTMWISDTAQDCDSGFSQPDASADGSADATFDASVDAPADSPALDAPASDAEDAAEGGDDDANDGAASDGDDGG
jgi:hypothetical protein